VEREYMEFDVVIVGAGPAGLSAACRLKQKAAEAGKEISVCVVEKGSEVGAHILSGAVFEPRALNELFPDWKELGAPLNTPVKRDDIYVLRNAESATKVPDFFVPKTMHNEGNYIISLGNLCRWLAQQAENLGVEVYQASPPRKPCSTKTAWSAESSPATWAWTVKANPKKASTPPVWNCAANTPCSPKAAVATSASN
jgi:flavin-dependent dehydrogenase